VTSWHECTGDERTDSATFTAMSISAQVNAAKGPMVICSGEDWTLELIQTYLRSLIPMQLYDFVEDAISKSPTRVSFRKAQPFSRQIFST
jgi:hypothetical protein